ncbi:TonB-dependent receptor [Novosphingobium sp. FSW06-99]|uniref:TonB-dependent receptor n=1 Tax=Novosphingobium sp. FSW06-99 TaxID=1739113 RepID=UPI000ABE06D3|nr:TonB-dependent receptor [Novosphingobium sp. FSW06-99]
MMTVPATAQAAAQLKQFSIDAQSAETAIGEFGHQAGVQIVAPRKLTRSVRTNPVHGELSVAAALDRLFAGTGLEVRQTGPQTFAVVAKPVATAGPSAVASAALVGRTAVAEETSAAQPAAPPAADPTQGAAAPDAAPIIVTGLRASLDNSRGIKRAASGIVDAISIKDIGKLPDANLAESLQRITGVSIDRSGGEGAFITVRGFGPEFNTVLVNGRQLATPTDPSQASGRAFSFDTLASELVSGVEVYKSSTARFQSGGVGSTVNIKTARPFDYNGLKFSSSVDVNYDTNAKKAAPDGSFLFSDTTHDGNFGVLLSGSYQHRYGKLNTAQTDGWLVNPAVPGSQVNGGAGTVSASNPNGNLFIPQDFDERVITENRERIGGTLVLQYRPNNDLTITADALYSKFTDTTDSRSFGNWFTATNLTNVKTDANGTAIDMTQASGIAEDFHDEKFDKRTNTKAFGLNADWKISEHVSAVFDVNYSVAKEDPNNGQENELALLGYDTGYARFQSDSSVLPWLSQGLPVAGGGACPGSATNSGVASSSAVVGQNNQGANEQLCQHVMFYRGYGTDDQVVQARADFVYKSDSKEGLTRANWGLYVSQDRKDTAYDSNEDDSGNAVAGYLIPAPASVPISVFNAGSNFLSGISGASRLPTQWLTFDAATLFSAITAQQQATNPGFTFAPHDINDTVVRERVFGSYFESQFDGALADRPFSLVAGVRVELTSAYVNGLATAYTGLRYQDPTDDIPVSSGTTRTVGTNNYVDILPNLAFKWLVSDTFTARLAASQTLTRPTLEQLSPVTTLNTYRPGDFAASTGNPNLKPFKSDNLDISGEYYYARASYVSLGGFLKNVSNFIVLNQTTGPINGVNGPLIDPGTPSSPNTTNAPAQWTITAPINGADATVVGLEAAWQHALGNTGIGWQVNGTLVHSNRQLNPQDVSQKFALTGLSNSANAVLFYDKNGIEARIAWNWRAHFLQYLTPPPNGAGQAVTQVRAYQQFDASLGYHLNKQYSVFFEAANLTDSKLEKYAYYTNQFLYAEDSGRRFKAGVRYNF